MPASLYRRLLGAELDRLPEPLRSFHDRPGGGRAFGRVRVERGGSWAAQAIGRVLGLPAAGDDVPVDLEVRVEAGRERWLRRFPDATMASTQWQDGSLLIEQTGPIQTAMRVVAHAAGIRFESERASLLGLLRVPPALTPRARAEALGADAGWTLDVELTAPGVGLVLRFSGRVEPA